MRNVMGVVAAVALAACCGCVERRLQVRSEPPGGPVWIDEEEVGVTPMEYEFVDYGIRRVRVGPIRDENERVQYLATERLVKIKAPWYDTFPVVDFLFEVLCPFTITDWHECTIALRPASEQEQLFGVDRARAIKSEGEEFRDKALNPVPELIGTQ